MRRRALWLLCALSALWLAGVPALAKDANDEKAKKDRDWIITLQFENDLFGNTDQHFSHGMRAAVMSPDYEVPDWAEDLAGKFPFFDAKNSRRGVFSLGQSIFTPTDLATPTLQTNDRPYAGWLYLGMGLVSVSPDGSRLDNIELDVGVVGPASFADEVQTRWHRWFDFQNPEGWDNQIKNEPGILLTYERKWRFPGDETFMGMEYGLTPHLGLSLGNILTQAAGGMTLRFGNNLRGNRDFGPPRIRPSLPGSDFFKRSDRFSWYFFIGGEGRAVARNISLDGNSFADSHSVDKETFVGDFQAGLAFLIGSWRLAYTHVYRTREFEAQDSANIFGAFSISKIF